MYNYEDLSWICLQHSGSTFSLKKGYGIWYTTTWFSNNTLLLLAANDVLNKIINKQIDNNNDDNTLFKC